jgi:predicted MFS family arabinose efflux permease
VVLSVPGAVRWSCGELLAYSGWAGCLVFVGALFVESYGLSLTATGLVLGVGALAYVPGNLLARRWVDHHPRALLVGLALGLAATVAVLGVARPDVLCFLAGGRTLVGSASGLHLAPQLRLGITGVRTAALQFGYFIGAALGGLALGVGGYQLLGLAFSALFVGAALPHVWPRPRGSAAAFETLEAPEQAV